MVNFWKIVDSVIDQSDVLLLVVDARMVAKTRNVEVVRKSEAAGKPLITVINKCDLVEKEQLEAYKKTYSPCVFVSAQKFYGMTMLRKKILELSKGESVTVGVVGYPNTGKSSVINALKGKASAGTSPVSGYTKGIQRIKVDNKIMILDTPGVLADSDDKASLQLAITASRTDMKDPDLVAYELLNAHATEILAHYRIATPERDPEVLLELIAEKLHRFKPGGIPDTETTARMLLQDWQKGKIQV